MNGYLQIDIKSKPLIRSEDTERQLWIDENQYPVFISSGYNHKYLDIQTKRKNNTVRKTVHLLFENSFDLRRRKKKVVVAKHTANRVINMKKQSRSLWIVPSGLVLLRGIIPGDILVQDNKIYIFHDLFWVFLGFDSGSCNSQLYIQENEPVSLIGDRWLNPVTGLLLSRTTNIADEPVWCELYYSSGVCTATDLAYSDTPPLNPNIGDRWFDSSSGVFYTYIVDINGDLFWIDTTA